MNMWIGFYDRVNLNPLTRVRLHVWCQYHIYLYLQAGEAFYPESVNSSAQEMYCLLPEFWYGMKPDQKKEVQAIFPGYDEIYTPACLRHIHEDFNIPYSNMINICVCLVIDKDHPQTLDWKLTDKKKLPTDPIEDVEDAQKMLPL